MQANNDGSVVLTAAEAREVSKVLRLGRELIDQIEGGQLVPGTCEDQLLEAIELLEELGVSPEELTEKVDSGRKPG